MSRSGDIPATGVRSGRTYAAPAVALLFLVVCWGYFRASSSADLLALWQAGRALAAGRPDLVYPLDSAYFTMLPPAEWLTELGAQGYRGNVFPYLYPPLWAQLMALLSNCISFAALQNAASAVNPMLLIGLLLAARRIAAPTMSAAIYIGAGGLVLLLSSLGSVALYQNQPQILVAFLTVLAIERSEAGHEREAGAVLAIAAALKIYPAFYAILWLAAGKRRAALTFAVCGAVLAGLSVVLAGWPLHQRFLELLHTISGTAMLSHITYSWESVIGGMLYPDQLHTIVSSEVNALTPTAGSWRVLEKPAAFSLVFKVLQIAALAILAVAFRKTRTPGARALLWPVAFATLSLLGPMAWSYHYLAVAAFAPCLIDRLGLHRGLALLVLMVLLTSPWMARLFVPPGGPTPELSRNLQAVGTVTMTGMTLALLAVRNRRPLSGPAS